MSDFFSANWPSILSIILSIPISILANLMTPKVKAWWARRSIGSIEREIKEIEEEMREMNDVVSQPSIAVAFFAKCLAECFKSTLFFIFGVGVFLLGFIVLPLPSTTVVHIFELGDMLKFFGALAFGILFMYVSFAPIYFLFSYVDIVLGYEEWKNGMQEGLEELNFMLSQKLNKT